MKAGTEPERPGSLVIELATGTAVVNGTRVEMPPGEFQLLAALATRPGEVFSSDQLLDLVWPGDPVVANQDLRWRVWKVRDRIGDKGRERMILGNRPRFGYLIDLPPSSVSVLEGAPDVADTGEPDVVYLGESSETANESLTPVDVTAGPTNHHGVRSMDAAVEVTRPSFRPRIVFLAAALGVTLLTASWGAGSWLSRLGRIDQSALAQQGGDAPVTHPSTGSSKHGAQETKDPRKANRTNASRRHSDSAATTWAAPPSDSTSADSSSAATDPGTNPPSDTATRDGATSIPTQPDARLFHLYNPDSGDHYMTTISSTANQKQAAGYQMSTEGRVFSKQEKGTVAITLDDGTAFVYRDSGSAPQGIDVAALYRLTKDGDFFYAASTSQANEAQASGWSLSTVGYVAT